MNAYEALVALADAIRRPGSPQRLLLGVNPRIFSQINKESAQARRFEPATDIIRVEKPDVTIDIRVLHCAECNAPKPDVEIRIDPYLHEIYGEEIQTPLCTQCFSDRIAET